ncbi:MAG: J domain-containing protein [Bernardetiaceae bacterium]|nr:J domain-containing protein [Bernardetiaceae bacterium]
MSLFNRIKNIVRANVNDFKENAWEGKSFEDYINRIDKEYDKAFRSGTESADYEEQNWQQQQQQEAPKDTKAAQYYRELGLPVGSSYEQIRQAYRKLMKEHHPDRFQDPQKQKIAAERSKKITEAYAYFKRKNRE